ncbi:hypothetical protein XM40_18735 [Bacillus velezensis]|nr:hypothetical protein SB45_18710 [Bacillus velezensis]AKD24140.1 hypothetical protein XM40_18735 [Bacillus velezensis]
MTPMTRRIADADKSRLVFAFCFFEGLFSLRVPVYGGVGVLEQIGDFSVIKLLGLLLFGMGSPLFIHICMFNIPQSSKIIHTLNKPKY